ncbi:hypothetical protein LINGRAHAP2_LOCUS12997 [Linum grandiflorum]
MHDDHTEPPKLTKKNNDEDIRHLLLIPIVLFLYVGVMYGCYSSSLHLNPSVVSSFVSSSSNGSHLISSWDVTLDLGIKAPQGFPVDIDRVEASLSHPAGPHPAVFSTRLFRIKREHDSNIGRIQLRVEDDGARGGFDSSLQFGVSVQIWARLGRGFFSDRYYFAQVNCFPDWIGSSELVRWLSMDEKKCQFHLIEQSNSDEKLGIMNTDKMKTVESTKRS